MHNKNSDNKAKIAIVGAFPKRKVINVTGGQLKAGQILAESGFFKTAEVFTIDTTMRSLPPPHTAIRSYFALLRIFKVLKVCIVNRPRVLLLFSSSGASFIEKILMVAIAKILGIKTALFPRSGHILTQVNKSQFFSMIVKYGVKLSDIILCQSQSWKEYYVNMAGRKTDKYHVIPNWIKPRKRLPSTKSLQPDQPTKVLFMGWIEVEKGVFDLVSIANNLADQKVEFHICGKGSKLEKLKNQIREKGLDHMFRIHNWVAGKQKVKILDASDIIILPSYAEGMPNIILEAMEAAKPIIATNVGAIPELLREQSCGFVFNPGDVSGMTKAIIDLSMDESLRLELGKIGRQNILEHHDIRKVWPKMLGILTKQL